MTPNSKTIRPNWKKPLVQSKKVDDPAMKMIRFQPNQFVSFRSVVAFGDLVDRKGAS